MTVSHWVAPVERSRKQDTGPILENNLLNNVWKHSSSFGGLRVQRKICRWKVRETDDRMFKIIVATVTNSSYFSTAYFSLHPQASIRRRMLPNGIKKVIFEYGTPILLPWPFHQRGTFQLNVAMHFWPAESNIPLRCFYKKILGYPMKKSNLQKHTV